MSVVITRNDWWRIHRALVKDGAATELIEKVQDVIEMGARGFQGDVEEDDTLEAVCDVLEDLVGDIEDLTKVVESHQRTLELQLEASKLHGRVLDKHEDTIGHLLLAVGSPDEEYSSRIEALEVKTQGLVASLDGTDLDIDGLEKKVSQLTTSHRKLAKLFEAHRANAGEVSADGTE